MSHSCHMWIRHWEMHTGKWVRLAVEVPARPQHGPSDGCLKLIGMNVKPDQNGNFTRDDYSELELDAVHTFASARLAIDLWEKATDQKIIWRNTDKKKIGPLPLHIHCPIDGAVFNPNPSIYYGEFGPGLQQTCKSFDIVVHEITHAIVHSFLPKVHQSLLFELHAIMEAIADLTPIFTILQIPEIRTKVFESQKFDWHQPNFLSEFAEGFGSDGFHGIRSALSGAKAEVTIYDAAENLTSRVYNRISKLSSCDLILTLAQSFFIPLLNLDIEGSRVIFNQGN